MTVQTAARFAQPLVIREGAWQVTLDTSHPLVQMGLELGDMPWVPEALTVLCSFMAAGMTEDEALEACNAPEATFALLERVQF